MGLQHFSHDHPLIFNEDQPSHESKKQAYCRGCGELVVGPSFSCAKCGFYLNKECAEAPSEINHPFHRDHSLKLLVSPPYICLWGICDFCDKRCDKFVYHCSCGLDFHIKCALLSINIAEKRFGELEDIGHKDPLLSAENRYQELKEAECLACWKPLLGSTYLSLDSGFCLHKKCVDLPIEINHLCHRQHPLILQFNSKRLPCQMCHRTQPRGFVYCCSQCELALHIACAELPAKLNHPCHRKHPLFLKSNLESLPCQICQETQFQGFVYYCSICKFALHVKCLSPPPSIKGEIHEHPFTLFWRQVSFICDACGTIGDHVSYTCSTCSLIVHEKCISLPRIIKLPRHHHPLSHTFNLGEKEIETWKCRICSNEVNAEYGSYCCSDCNYIVHTNCAKEEHSWYEFDEIDQADEEPIESSVYSVHSVVKETKLGESVIPIEIKHLSHHHNLVLSNDATDDDKFCVGCLLFISTSFYYCSKCDFFLHKSCAESPRKKHIWTHRHQNLLTLVILDRIFLCNACLYEFNIGFAYECNVCGKCLCLRCALISDTATCKGHEHLLTFYGKYEAQCSGCGGELKGAWACKDCNFALCYGCLVLPDKTQHKCDEHPLMLTYHDNNDYSEHQFCDICEERRDPNHWFYCCVICDTTAHPYCVIRRYPFMKLGYTYIKGDHPHSLTFTNKVYDYPECHICHQRCLDLAVECVDNGCDYIVHWECVKPSIREAPQIMFPLK